MTRISLAYWALESRKLDDGHKFGTDAATEFAEEKDAGSEGAARLILAELWLSGENKHDALTELEKAQKLAESANDSRLKLRAKVTLAKIDAESGKADAAIGALQSAEKEARKSGDVSLELEVRVALGQAQMKAGKLAQGKATLASAGQEAKLKGFGLLARNAGAASEIVAGKNTDSR
jgi:tetratricopeptide (TPR) repeat protein